MSTTFNSRHPGDAEYAGALAQIHEQTGRSHAQAEYRRRGGRIVPTFAVGDYVTWDDGSAIRSGYVLEVLDENANIYHVAHHKTGGGREHYAVDGDTIRPW